VAGVGPLEDDRDDRLLRAPARLQKLGIPRPRPQAVAPVGHPSSRSASGRSADRAATYLRAGGIAVQSRELAEWRLLRPCQAFSTARACEIGAHRPFPNRGPSIDGNRRCLEGHDRNLDKCPIARAANPSSLSARGARSPREAGWAAVRSRTPPSSHFVCAFKGPARKEVDLVGFGNG
jgi:hypothetical protein